MLCVASGCKNIAVPSYFMCFYHWARVPPPMQRKVFKTFKLGQDYPAMADHLPWNVAMQDAVNEVARLEKRPIPFSDDEDFELELVPLYIEDDDEDLVLV